MSSSSSSTYRKRADIGFYNYISKHRASFLPKEGHRVYAFLNAGNNPDNLVDGNYAIAEGIPDFKYNTGEFFHILCHKGIIYNGTDTVFGAMAVPAYDLFPSKEDIYEWVLRWLNGPGNFIRKKRKAKIIDNLVSALNIRDYLRGTVKY